MKKFLLSILTMMYMLVSSGVALEIHYCMGKQAGVDFYKYENDKCARCGMKEKKSGCCHDVQQFHKLSDFHKNVFNEINFKTVEQVLISNRPVFAWNIISTNINPVFSNTDPPLIYGPPARVMNGVFRI